MKSFGVRFYTANCLGDAPVVAVADLLQSIYEASQRGELSPQLEDEGCRYEIRELQSLGAATSFKGVLAVVRDDAPHIRAADGAERKIDLEEEEGVLEKNYFLFFRQHNLLVWQVNGRASHVMRFERYLSMLSPNTIVFDDVIDRGSLARLQAGTVKRIQVRIALPKNAEAYDPEVWEGGAFDMMAGVGATTMQFELATRRKGRGLERTVKEAVHRLLNRKETRAVRVRMDGQRDFIDLMADCITDQVQVQMFGLYPNPTSVFAELASAKDRQYPRLEAYFGIDDQVLD